MARPSILHNVSWWKPFHFSHHFPGLIFHQHLPTCLYVYKQTSCCCWYCCCCCCLLLLLLLLLLVLLLLLFFFFFFFLFLLLLLLLLSCACSPTNVHPKFPLTALMLGSSRRARTSMRNVVDFGWVLGFLEWFGSFGVESNILHSNMQRICLVWSLYVFQIIYPQFH